LGRKQIVAESISDCGRWRMNAEAASVGDGELFKKIYSKIN